MIKQEALESLILNELVQNLRYRDWLIYIDKDLDRGQGSRGTTLVIRVHAKDSSNPQHMIYVNHYMIVPAASYDMRSWRRWLFEQICLVERHEAAEFFTIGDERPYSPSHGPGNDPYMIREIGEPIDFKLDHLGKER